MTHCPICGSPNTDETDMAKLRCTNASCRSNGGTMDVKNVTSIYLVAPEGDVALPIAVFDDFQAAQTWVDSSSWSREMLSCTRMDLGDPYNIITPRILVPWDTEVPVALPPYLIARKSSVSNRFIFTNLISTDLTLLMSKSRSEFHTGDILCDLADDTQWVILDSEGKRVASYVNDGDYWERT